MFAGDNVGIFIQKFVVNSEIQVFSKQLHSSPSSVSSKVTYFGKNWKPITYYLGLLIINNNLGGILPNFRDSAGFLLKTAVHSYSIRILGRSPCTISKMLDPRDAKTLS